MHMRKFRHARLPDQAKRCARIHRIAHGHAHRPHAHMTILRLPAAAMVNHHAIAAFFARHLWRKIFHPVADTRHSARRCGQHGHATFHRSAGGYGKIRAVMPIIGQRAAGEITPSGAGVMVKILLDIAGFTQGAVHWQGQIQGPCRKGKTRANRGAG